MTNWNQADITPGEHIEVIVFAPAEDPPIFTAQIICGEWTRYSGGICALKNDYVGDPEFNVTHWMYLPSPPTPSSK